jgi:putative oxidoreductase
VTSLRPSTQPQLITTVSTSIAHTTRVRLLEVLIRASLPLLRISLGIVFLWFGTLKIAQATPVGDLVARTVPFVPADRLVPALGAFEVLLGLGLLAGRRMGIVAALMVAHLSGTLLVLVTQPQLAFRDGNPLVLTMTGEFVVKNLVLISAGLVLATAYLNRGRTASSTGADETDVEDG